MNAFVSSIGSQKLVVHRDASIDVSLCCCIGKRYGIDGDRSLLHCRHLMKYRWNSSVIFYGIVPSNPRAYRGRGRQNRNHGKIVPERSTFWKLNQSVSQMTAAQFTVFDSRCRTESLAQRFQ